jgi:twitching motility protein PilT
VDTRAQERLWIHVKVIVFARDKEIALANNDRYKTFLGQLALDYGFINQEQLDYCLDLQRQTQPRPLLGELLIDSGYIDEGNLERLLSAQRRQINVAEVSRTRAKRTRLLRSLKNAKLIDYIRALAELDASELHLSSGARPFVRMQGNVITLSSAAIDHERCEQLLFSMVDLIQIEQFQKNKSISFLLPLEGLGRFITHYYFHRKGVAGVFRRVPEEIPERSTLNIPSLIDKIPNYSQGLILITGPHDSGKTTTLATIIDMINQSQHRHIITIEKPIEYVFKSASSLIAQREVGLHVPDFTTALRCCLREDPDIIVMGDLAEPDHFQMALTAAETGHLVLGAVRSPTTYQALLRIIETCGGRIRTNIRNMLASFLKMVICQQLVPSVDRSRLHLAMEVLMVNPAVQNLIREDRIHQIPQVMQTARNEGMILMDDALMQLVEQEIIPIGEAVARAEDPQRFLNLDGD